MACTGKSLERAQLAAAWSINNNKSGKTVSKELNENSEH